MTAIIRRVQWTVLGGVFCAMGLIWLGLTLKRAPDVKLPAFSYLPTPQSAPFVFPGQEGFGASVAWVLTILHFADCLLDGADPRFLADLVEITTELDPHWQYPVEFGGVVIGGEGGRANERTVKLLERGIGRFPANWKLRIYLVHSLRHGRLGLSESVIADSCAKVLLPITTGKMESPEYARTLAFTLIQKSGRPDEAMRQLLSMMRMIDDPLLQVRYQEKMGKLLRGSLARIGSDSLEFPKIAGAMLKSGDAGQVSLASQVLVELAADSTNPRAMAVARELVGQYRAFEAQAGR